MLVNYRRGESRKKKDSSAEEGGGYRYRAFRFAPLSSLGHANDVNLRNLFVKAIKSQQDEDVLKQLEQHLPKFLELNSKCG